MVFPIVVLTPLVHVILSPSLQLNSRISAQCLAVGHCICLRQLLDVGSFWPGNFQRGEKVHKLSPRCPLRLLWPFSVPTHPRSNPRMSIECILGELGFPAPSAHLAGKKGASSIKEAKTEDWLLLPRGQSSRERGCSTAPYHVTSKGS